MEREFTKSGNIFQARFPKSGKYGAAPDVRPYEMRKKKMHWIEERLQQLKASHVKGAPKRNKSALAEALGLQPSRITELLNGERQVQGDEIEPLAAFLLMSVEQVASMVGGSNSKPVLDAVVPVRVRGIVQAGVWSESTELDPEDQGTIYISAAAMKYKNTYAMKVRGDSMNRVFPEGTTLLIAPLHEYFGKYVSGLYVIVQKERAGEYELTVKELQIVGSKHWLWPRSTEPQWQQPIEVLEPSQWGHPQQIDGFTVSVVGIVTDAHRSVLPE